MHPHINLFGVVDVPTYILIISLTYCLGVIWVVRRAEKQGADRNRALDLCLLIMVAGFLGARLTHILYEEPGFYWEHPLQIFYFWQGGFVFFGGLLAALAGARWYLHRVKDSFLQWANFFAPVGAGGYALGRLACFFNGCCYGRYCEFPWAVSFEIGGEPLIPRHPTPLYATVWDGLLCLILLRLEKTRFKNSLFAFWIFFHGLGRLFMEHFRADFRGPVLGLSFSSWISLALMATALALFVKTKRSISQIP